MTQVTTIKVYNTVYSGHGHKVELFLKLLGLDFERIDADHNGAVTLEEIRQALKLLSTLK